MSQTIVHLTGVSHTYGRRGATPNYVLHEVDFELAAGEFAAIRGRSGSGKSTLLNIIGGILPPTQGQVRVEGRDLFSLDDASLSNFRGQTIGFVFQNYHLAPPLTAVENVMVPALLAGQSGPAARQAALAKLEEVGLAEKSDDLPSELSGGQMQRVALARALINNPAILLADEPTGNLDEETGGEILALLGRYNRDQGLTVIMATHDENVGPYATRRLRILADGRLDANSIGGPADDASAEAEA